MLSFYMKVLAAACGLLVTLVLLLGNRATQRGLSLVARVHDKNLDQEASGSPVQVRFTGASKHLSRAEIISRKLRVVGIVLVVLAAALTVCALCIERLGPRIAEPDGPANGSQPIRSETNSTSSAAGSLR